MNLKKKMRRGSLAALITLALTSSALAMPTGGEVVGGNPAITLSGGTWDSVANNATITATNDGQINWQTFSIANGETLNFDVPTGKLLLNQVTGTQVSDILGTMRQTGGGEIALVNPNGIHIGQNAVLDVNQLTLSTLGVVTKNDTETLLRQGALGARAITVDQGAQFEIARKLNLFGGQVNVADGVVFNLNDVPNPQESMLEIVAAKELYWQQGSDHDSDLSKWTMERGNTVDFHGTVNALSTGKDAEINILGYAVNADRAHIDGDRAEVSLAAWTKLTSDDRNNAPVKTTKIELSPENVVRADGLRIREKKSTEIRGGKVELKNSTIDSARLDITGHKSFNSEGDMDRSSERQALTATADNSVTLDNVTINGMTPQHGGYHWFEITGGTVNILNSNIHTEKTLNVSAISSLDRTMKNRHWATPIELVGTRTTTGANALNVKNSTLRVTRPAWESDPYIIQADLNAKDVKLTGGTVHLTDVQIDTPLLAQIMAGITTEGEDEPYDQTAHTPSTTVLQAIRTTLPHTVTIDGTSNIRATDVGIGAGKVTVGNDATFAFRDTSGGAFDLLAGSRSATGDESVTNSVAGNEVQFHGKILGMGTTDHTVDITGATVNLDGAQIGAVGNQGVVNVMAAGTTRISDADRVDIAANAGNALRAEGLTVNSSKTNMAGGNVALKNSSVRSSGSALIAAVGRIKFDGAQKTATAANVNVVHLDNTTVNGSDVTTVSGKVNLTNGTQVTGNDVTFRIGRNFVNDHVDTTKDNTLSMWNSHVAGTDVLLAAGGAEVYQGSTVIASDELEQGDVTRTDGSTRSLLKDASSSVKHHNTVDAEGFTVKDAADVPAVPDMPQPPAIPDMPTLSEDDQANIAEGNAKAQIALTEATQEARSEALTKTVAQLNEKVGTSRRQTAGVVVGIVQEIANAATLSDGEKVALVESVLNAYAPVQEAKAEQDNVATNTLDEAVNAAANVSAAPVYPDETEAEDVVSFA